MGLAKRLAPPFAAINIAFLVFLLWTFLFLEPGDPTYPVALLAAGVLVLNILLATGVIYIDRDI